MTVMREPFPGNPPPLTTRPEGLLDLLGLQQNGRYPQHLETNTLGVGLDLLRWYLESRATFKTGTINSTAGFVTDGSGNLTIPNNEHWIVLQFNMQAQTAPAAAWRGWLARTNGSGGSLVSLSQTESTATGQRPHLRVNDTTGQFYLARPSVRLGLFVDVTAAATFDYTLRYVRLQTG